MAYVYKHIREDNEEIFYIGVSRSATDCNGIRNYYRAKSSKKRNKKWHVVTSKTKWHYEIVYDNLTNEEASKKELELIHFHHATLVNTNGVPGQKRKPKNLTKPKRQNPDQGTKGIGIKPWNKGKKNVYSESTLNKMRLSGIGKNKVSWKKNKVFNKTLKIWEDKARLETCKPGEICL